ncbi:MAG: hypothetical protein JXN64_08755 [Spirochaetes bacterium]|nr:hypothetical protein [Spirochaetota bacterium]
MYNDLTIYYFSGTGNALTASRWIAGYARKKKLKTNLVSIDRFIKITVPPAQGHPGFAWPRRIYCCHQFNSSGCTRIGAV